MHEYYAYGKEELMRAPKIPLEIFPDKESCFRSMAERMIEVVRKTGEAGKDCLMIVPVGPVGQYPFFVERVNKERISLTNCTFINMDEYLTDEGKYIEETHPLSFRGFMQREVYGKIDAALLPKEEQRVFPDPANPAYVTELVAARGGVDAVFGGIGLNGHLAFNEACAELPEAEFCAQPTRVLDIARETRACNAIGDFGGKLEDMPSRCITVGFKEILSAKTIVLGVFRDWHRAVVRRAAYGERTAAFPVSFLQGREDVCILLPESVAAL